MAWSGAFGCLGKTHFFWIDEKVCLMNFKGFVISDKLTKRRKLRRLGQDHNWKTIGRVNQRVIATRSSSMVGINLDWTLLAILELPWILSEDFTALKDHPAHSQVGHTLGCRLSPSLSGTQFHLVAPTGASLPGWGDERGLNTVSIQAGENDFQINTSPQFSARQIQSESFLNHLQPDKFGKL